MVFLLVWAVLLVVFLMAAIYKGERNKDRVKRVGNKVNSLDVKVNKLWERIK